MFDCLTCGKSFKRLVGLNVHIWRMHTEEGRKHSPGKGKIAWSRGLTRHTHESIRRQSLYKRTPDEKLFSQNSVTSRLKERVLESGKIEYVCQECGLGPLWNGKVLVLHLDHRNGDRLDNRFENLRFLCPNCHTQQDTYSRKRGKKYSERISEIRAGLV